MNDNHDNTNEDVIVLGIASVETKGQFGDNEGLGILVSPGISAA
jgi:hypothetical protein